MTRVDFYIVGADSKAPLQVACRLAEKAYQRGHPVHIHAADAGQASELDTLLWTFQPGSFVPHALADTAMPDRPAVTIGTEAPSDDLPMRTLNTNETAGVQAEDGAAVLINLSAEVPLFFSRFERVAEIVAGGDQARAHGRERYRFYRERGYQLDTHTLDKA